MNCYKPMHAKPGSPPLARELPKTATPAPLGRRITPARAGITRDKYEGDGKTWDHPRSRGNYLMCAPRGRTILGSPPLARELQQKNPRNPPFFLLNIRDFIHFQSIPSYSFFTNPILLYKNCTSFASSSAL